MAIMDGADWDPHIDQVSSKQNSEIHNEEPKPMYPELERNGIFLSDHIITGVHIL